MVSFSRAMFLNVTFRTTHSLSSEYYFSHQFNSMHCLKFILNFSSFLKAISISPPWTVLFLWVFITLHACVLTSSLLMAPAITTLKTMVQIKINSKWTLTYFQGFLYNSAGKASTWKAGDPGSIPASGRSPGKGNSYPFQYSGLENSMDYIVMGSQRVGHNWVTFTFTLRSSRPKTRPFYASLLLQVALKYKTSGIKGMKYFSPWYRIRKYNT